MKKSQRIVLLIGAICVFHSSLVPPVIQAGGEICRYHEFTERAWPFTRLFGVSGSDGVALLTEYGIIMSLVAIAYLVIGMRGGAEKTDG